MGNPSFLLVMSIIGPIILVLIICCIVKAVTANELKKRQQRQNKQIQKAVKRWRTQIDSYDEQDINKIHKYQKFYCFSKPIIIERYNYLGFRKNLYEKADIIDQYEDQISNFDDEINTQKFHSVQVKLKEDLFFKDSLKQQNISEILPQSDSFVNNSLSFEASNDELFSDFKSENDVLFDQYCQQNQLEDYQIDKFEIPLKHTDIQRNLRNRLYLNINRSLSGSNNSQESSLDPKHSNEELTIRKNRQAQQKTRASNQVTPKLYKVIEIGGKNNNVDSYQEQKKINIDIFDEQYPVKKSMALKAKALTSREQKIDQNQKYYNFFAKQLQILNSDS